MLTILMRESNQPHHVLVRCRPNAVAVQVDPYYIDQPVIVEVGDHLNGAAGSVRQAPGD